MSYWWISGSVRQCGKTTAICKAAKEIGAVVLVHCKEEAKRIKEQYGVEAMTLKNPKMLLGRRKPFLVDSHAAAMELQKLSDKIQILQQEIEKSKEENKDLENYCVSLTNKLYIKSNEIAELETKLSKYGD